MSRSSHGAICGDYTDDSAAQQTWCKCMKGMADCESKVDWQARIFKQLDESPSPVVAAGRPLHSCRYISGVMLDG